MSNVCVTGGAGFVGSNLVRKLLSDGHKVVVVDDLSTGLMTNLDGLPIKFLEASVTDIGKIEREISNSDVIFHLAARGSVPRSLTNPIATHQVNANGTLNMLECARKIGAHIIISSSSSVYGRNNSLPKTEEMWVSPLTPYAASKLSAEAYAQAYSASYATKVSLFRFFNIFGPFQRPDHQYSAVIPKWIWAGISGQSIQIQGDGTQTRDFTYIDTVVDVLVDCMNEKKYTDTLINLAFGNRISLNEVINELKKYEPNLQLEYAPTRLGDVKDSQNSPKVVSEIFPKVLPVPFKDAFRVTYSWLKEYGNSIVGGPTIID